MEPVRTFRTFTDELHRLADWFAGCGVKTVVMESTGVYWIPVFEILEQRGFEVMVVNARDAKHVPGRKTDVSDAQWLQRLHEYGLLRASFRPQAEIAGLRAYLRQRERLLDYAAAHIQHMQNAMTQMNLQLHHVISDITGVTGMAIIRAIVAGERDPTVLASHRERGCHASIETMCQALVGNYREEHVFALTQALELYGVYQTKAAASDKQIQAILTRLKQNATPTGEQAAFRPTNDSPAQCANVRCPRGTPRHPWSGPHSNRRSGAIPRAQAGRGMRHQPDGMAERQALHVMAGARTSQQDFRRESAVVENASHQQSGRVPVAPRRRHRGSNRHRSGRVLPAVVGAGGQSEGDHRDRTQDRGAVLQHASARHDLCGSRRRVL
jgi:hypothetical protein